MLKEEQNKLKETLQIRTFDEISKELSTRHSFQDLKDQTLIAS
jgi:hypothetical protein